MGSSTNRVQTPQTTLLSYEQPADGFKTPTFVDTVVVNLTRVWHSPNAHGFGITERNQAAGGGFGDSDVGGVRRHLVLVVEGSPRHRGDILYISPQG